MIGKLLLTLLVIVLALVYLRKRYRTNRQNTQQRTTMPVPAASRGELEQFLNRARGSRPPGSATPDTVLPKVKIVLWAILGTILVVGGIGSYLHWQDQQRLVTVLLHRDASQAPVIYRVSKRNLSDSSFITEDGTRVSVSANERMEVVGL